MKNNKENMKESTSNPAVHNDLASAPSLKKKATNGLNILTPDCMST